MRGVQTIIDILKSMVIAVVGLAILAGVVVGGYYLIRFRGLFGATIIGIGFVTGFILPLLLAYLVPLGKFFGEALGGIFLLLALLAPRRGRTVLNMFEDGRYDLQTVDPDEIDGENTFWTRFAGVTFGVTYDRTENAFGDCVDDVNSRYDFSVMADGGLEKIDGGSVRGGFQEFVDVSEDSDKIFIAAAEKLHELYESASVDIGMKAKASALVDYGGDTSQTSPWVMLVGSLLMIILGVATSYLVL